MINRFLDSPVKTQDFIWLAAYMDGTFLSEFSYDSQKENSFYAIEKDRLIRFGLIGYGMNFYYEVLGGTFKLAGQMVEVIYKTDEKEYYLTGQQMMYQDLIQYKDAEATLNLFEGAGATNSKITQYNFGYKQNLKIDDANFNFKAICHIPYGKPIYLSLRISADSNLNGRLCIRKNGLTIEEFDAPLKANVAGQLNWELTM
ncbi:hypothetical protein [Paenibacillus oleatilyticus]|uniref:hypothetical protein n=1 Tax=Paenibacillus oleatilyticus TaxID=2594886 RepID=UPI001C1FD3DC|nr:hypothetical protein [Paenibacillus oleatilyticus]MBU7316164.1 hypothetical protein [Paenibacillus oleatilyticus]